MASSVNPLTGTTAPSPASTSSSTSANDLSSPNESVFLNLLVEQIKNQDPLNPTDSTQFVSQLAQFSELEQVIGIRGDTDTMASDMQSAAAATSAVQGSTSSANQTNGTTQTS